MLHKSTRLYLRFINSVKRSTLFFIAIAIYGLANAQQTDSLPITGGYLYYQVYGSGKPVVILTGGPGISCGQQEDVAINVGKEYQAILIEQRGTGKSITSVMDKEHITIDTSVADIKRVLDKMAIKEAVIYGHSYGSLLAMYFGVSYPKMVTRLIFAGPAPFNYVSNQMSTYADNKEARLGFADQQMLTELDAKASKGQLTRADSANFRQILNSTILYNKSNTDSIWQFVGKGKINNRTLVWLSSSYKNLDLTARIKKFDKPISIICGRQDPLAFMAYEYQLVNRKVTVSWIDRAGHFAMFEQGKAFYNALSQALKPISKG